MKLGVTGTREGMTAGQSAAFCGWGLLAEFTHTTVFRHGSCKGVDVQAAKLVKAHFGDVVRVIAHPGPDGDPCREVSGVDDETMPPKTHFARNRDIVNASDCLAAFPLLNERQARGGTWYTIDYARKVGKRVVIFWPDGRIEDSASPPPH